MKNLTRNRIHKASLFIQPESKCDVGCKGCYSINGSLASAEESIKAKLKLAKMIDKIKKDNLEFDQITLSINALDRVSIGNTAAYASMLKNVPKDKVHYAIAVNSIEDIEAVIDLSNCSVLNISIDKNKISKDTKIITKISSWVTILKEKNPDIHVNMNFLVTEDSYQLAGKTEDKVMILRQFARKFDSVHLIMEKPSDSERDNLFNNSDDSIVRFKGSFNSYVKHAIAIKQVYGNKVFIDSCVETALKNIINNTTFKCRAGVNHVSMWQDGSLTGCPYRTPNTKYHTGQTGAIRFATSSEIENVGSSEFDLCLYNPVLDMYVNIEEFASELKLTSEETEILKTIVK